MMDPDPEGEVGQEGGEWGGGGNHDAKDKGEMNAAQSIVSFSSQNETTQR